MCKHTYIFAIGKVVVSESIIIEKNGKQDSHATDDKAKLYSVRKHCSHHELDNMYSIMRVNMSVNFILRIYMSIIHKRTNMF